MDSTAGVLCRHFLALPTNAALYCLIHTFAGIRRNNSPITSSGNSSSFLNCTHALPMFNFFPVASQAFLNHSASFIRRVSKTGINPHQMQRHVILLRAQSRERQRLFRIAMIPRRKNAMRHVVTDHSVLNSLFVILIEICQDDLPHGGNGGAAISGEAAKYSLTVVAAWISCR